MNLRKDPRKESIPFLRAFKVWQDKMTVYLIDDTLPPKQSLIASVFIIKTHSFIKAKRKAKAKAKAKKK